MKTSPYHYTVRIVFFLLFAGVVLSGGQSCLIPDTDTEVCPSGLRCPVGWTCAAAQDVCIPGDCGNGELEDPEECDDGNLSDNDGCSRACVLEYTCGNGLLERRLV